MSFALDVQSVIAQTIIPDTSLQCCSSNARQQDVSYTSLTGGKACKKLLFFTPMEEHQSLSKWTAEIVKRKLRKDVCNGPKEADQNWKESQSFNPSVWPSDIVVCLCVPEWERETIYFQLCTSQVYLLLTGEHMKTYLGLQGYISVSASLCMDRLLQLIAISQQIWAELLWLALLAKFTSRWAVWVEISGAVAQAEVWPDTTASLCVYNCMRNCLGSSSRGNWGEGRGEGLIWSFFFYINRSPDV